MMTFFIDPPPLRPMCPGLQHTHKTITETETETATLIVCKNCRTEFFRRKRPVHTFLMPSRVNVSFFDPPWSLKKSVDIRQNDTRARKSRKETII